MVKRLSDLLRVSASKLRNQDSQLCAQVPEPPLCPYSLLSPSYNARPGSLNSHASRVTNYNGSQRILWDELDEDFAPLR